MPTIRMTPEIRLLPKIRLLPEIRAMPEIDLLGDVREQLFARYRDAIRDLALGCPDSRTIWSDQLADVAAALASATSAVSVADAERAAETDDEAAELLAAQVSGLKDEVSALAAQVRELARVIDSSRPQATPWLLTPAGATFLVMVTIAIGLASFIGDRVDSGQDQPPATPPPAVAPPVVRQDGQ